MNGSEMPSTVRELLEGDSLQALDPNCIVVQGPEDLQCLSLDILNERDYPIVGLAPSADAHEPVLAPSAVRAVVGPAARIYVFDAEELLSGLREMLGLRLSVQRGATRIWWPGASVSSDPSDHPLVPCLAGESLAETLAEFTRRFDLSRPGVREQIRLIDDTRAFLEYELTRMEERNRRLSERLRDTQIESHKRLTRAQAVEARLTAALHQLDSD
jgi:hypothetical protein